MFRIKEDRRYTKDKVKTKKYEVRIRIGLHTHLRTIAVILVGAKLRRQSSRTQSTWKAAESICRSNRNRTCTTTKTSSTIVLWNIVHLVQLLRHQGLWRHHRGHHQGLGHLGVRHSRQTTTKTSLGSPQSSSGTSYTLSNFYNVI